MVQPGYSLNNFRADRGTNAFDLLRGIEGMIEQRPNAASAVDRANEKEQGPFAGLFGKLKRGVASVKGAGKQATQQATQIANILKGNEAAAEFQEVLQFTAKALETTLQDKTLLDAPINGLKVAHKYSKIAEVVASAFLVLSAVALIATIYGLTGDDGVTGGQIALVAGAALMTAGIAFVLAQIDFMRKAVKVTHDEAEKIKNGNWLNGAKVVVFNRDEKILQLQVREARNLKDSIGKIIAAIDRMPINPLKFLKAADLILDLIKSPKEDEVSTAEFQTIFTNLVNYDVPARN